MQALVLRLVIADLQMILPFARTFNSMEELIADYESGALHPADVKPALGKSINHILQVILFVVSVTSLH